MVKTKFKRAVSLVMAAVLSLGVFANIGTTAYAASGTKSDVYIMQLPRSGDTNNNGKWGHGELKFMNGWYSHAISTDSLRAMGSYSGNIAYCIEPGTSQHTGDTLTEKNEDYFNNLGSNGTISGDDIRLNIGRILQYGYCGSIIHGNIQLTKVDADYPDNKLTGATFEVYRDVNGDGKLDDGDELIGNLKETSTGIYEMKELLYGKYLVRETKAPDGFELDKGVYSVFIENDETTYNVENKAGVGFINQAMKGNLKIKKTSSDGKVEGFTFRVTGENGYDRSFTTDKNGEIFIEGLRIGEYTVSEVGDSVSAGYVLPADKKASVKVGSTTVVEMHNVLRDTPKTGDNSKVGLWTVLAGLSALGIAGTVFAALRKKKKEDDE